MAGVASPILKSFFGSGAQVPLRLFCASLQA